MLPSTPTECSSALYTPFQVRIASFIGGPFAAVYTLYHNFKRLDNPRGTRLTLCLGGGFIVALLAIIPFLPDRFPNSVIPLAYSLAAGGVATSKQLSKDAILASGKYVRCTGWNVFLVILISLVSFCGIMASLLFALDHFEIITLA